MEGFSRGVAAGFEVAGVLSVTQEFGQSLFGAKRKIFAATQGFFSSGLPHSAEPRGLGPAPAISTPTGLRITSHVTLQITRTAHHARAVVVR